MIEQSEYCETQSPFSGEIEVDKSYCGTNRVKGKRGRSALVKQRSLLSSNVMGVATLKSSQTTEEHAQAILRGRVTLNSAIYI